MHLHEEQMNQVTALTVKGRVDSTTAAMLGQKLESVVAAASGRLVVDFRDLEYISSAGFRVLLIAARRAESSGGRMVLCCLSSKVRQLFDLGGFLDIFAITATRDDAVVNAAS